MTRKKSKRRKAYKTIFIACEGCREHEFLTYIKDLFYEELQERNIRIEIDDKKNNAFGGTPEKRLSTALKNESKYNIVIAWLDDDVQIEDARIHRRLEQSWCVGRISDNISLDELKKLNINNRNPIIILAQPLSIESVIIRILGKDIPNLDESLSAKSKVNKLKNSLSGIFGFKDVDKEYQYYLENLSKEDLISRARNIECLKKLFEILNIKL